MPGRAGRGGAGITGRLAPYAGAVRRPAPLPSLDELGALGRPFGIEHLGVAPADVLERARAALHERRDAGLAADMGFTYRDPDRSTDPARAVVGARSIIVAARSYLADEEPPAPPSGVAARVARYAWSDHYAPLRDGLRTMARRLRAAGHRAVAFADDNAIVDREVAHRAGLGWFGKNANLLLPGAGSWFVLGCVITTASYPVAADAGRRRLRPVPPVPRRLPDRRDRGAGGDRRQPLPRLGAAAPRRHPGRAPAGGRRPPVRLRRLPRGVPADRPPGAAPPAAVAGGCRAVGRRARAAGGGRRDAARSSRSLVHRRPRAAVAPSQRPRHPRQHGGPGRPAGGRHVGPVSPRRRRRCSPSTPGGPATRLGLDRHAGARP